MSLTIKGSRKILQRNPLGMRLYRRRVNFNFSITGTFIIRLDAGINRILFPSVCIRHSCIATIISCSIIGKNVISKFTASRTFRGTPIFQSPVYNRGKAIEFISRRNGITAIFHDGCNRIYFRTDNRTGCKNE